MDRTGRLQIPSEYLERLDIKERARLRLESDHVEVQPESAPREEPEGWWRPVSRMVRVENVSRDFEIGGQTIHALQDVSFR